MTSPPNTSRIPHYRTCNRPKPVLRLSWKQEPEQFCPGCGRSALALDQRPMKKEDR